VIAEIELAFRHLEGRVPRSPGQGEVHDDGRPRSDAARGRLRRAGGGNIGAPLVGLVEGSTEATTSGRGVELPARGHGALPRPRRRLAQRLPDHLDRHPRSDVRGGEGPGLPNQGRRTGRLERRRPRRPGEARRALSRKLLVRVTGEPLASGDGAFFEGGLGRLRLTGAPRRSSAGMSGPAGAQPRRGLLVAAAAARVPRAPGRDRPPVRGFRGVAHVLEHVADDWRGRLLRRLKATNVEAARRSLEASARPVLVVLGGRYKGETSPISPRPRDHGRRVLAIARRGSAVRAALEDVVRWRSAPRSGRQSRAPTPRRGRGMSCCSPRPARPSTCSRTTPTAAVRSRPR